MYLSHGYASANMQVCHPLRLIQINISMADPVISIFQTNTGTCLTTYKVILQPEIYYSNFFEIVLINSWHSQILCDWVKLKSDVSEDIDCEKYFTLQEICLSIIWAPGRL